MAQKSLRLAPKAGNHCFCVIRMYLFTGLVVVKTHLMLNPPHFFLTHHTVFKISIILPNPFQQKVFSIGFGFFWGGSCCVAKLGGFLPNCSSLDFFFAAALGWAADKIKACVESVQCCLLYIHQSFTVMSAPFHCET